MDKEYYSSLAIIIPTKSRHDWVVKLIEYYTALEYKGILVFVDSTKTSDYKNLKNLSKKLNFLYIHAPNESVHQALATGIEQLPKSVRYVIQTGDDDYICTDSLPKLVNFLNTNLDYNAAYGRAFALGIKNKFKNSVKIIWCRKYWQGYEIRSADYIVRMQEILNNYLNLEFAVRRKESVLKGLKDMNKKVGILNFSESTTLEILAVVDTALAGKVKFIHTDYLLRGDHTGRPNREQRSLLSQYLLTNKFDILNDYLVDKVPKLYRSNKKFHIEKVKELLLMYVEKSIIHKSVERKERNTITGFRKRIINKIEGDINYLRLYKYLKIIESK